jgi:prepilin-type N-terminal cleavage/methylation domain-containing protein
MPGTLTRPGTRGFTLLELLVAMALGLIILAGTIALFRQGVDVSHSVTQRAEMQQNARTAINLISRDLTVAGTSLPPGGIVLPNGGTVGADPPRRGCDAAGTCGNLVGGYPGSILYYVTPGDALGPTINSTTTDVVTVVYLDDSLNPANGGLLSQPLVDIDPSGVTITVASGTDEAAINDPASGLQAGDVVLLRSPFGPALGVVTTPPGGSTTFTLASSDALRLNWPGLTATGGNITVITPGCPGACPATTLARVHIVSYFIDDTDPNEPRLMRQVNANAAVPVALNVENLQITYDVINLATSLASANLSDPSLASPPAGPNQIRKANIVVTTRSPVRGLFRRSFNRMTLATSVSIRNLGWFDRYQ